jgi:hypothetical protein
LIFDDDEARKLQVKESDAILPKLLPNGPKEFPKDFLGKLESEVKEIRLPPENIEVAQLSDGKHVVRSSLGFCHIVKNEVEGKFILYASLRDQQVVYMSEKMLTIFQAVKAYENYLHKLRDSLIQAYEHKSGHRPIAEHKTREVFRSLGLPWMDKL